MKTVLTAFVLAACCAGQQPGTIAGPVLGMVFQSGTGAIRPLLGVSASSRLGAALDAGPALAQAAAAETYAVGVEADNGAAMLISAAGRNALAGVPAEADRVVLSPSGTAAAFYFNQSRTAYLVSGLPDSPSVAGQAITGSQPFAMAVSDDGSTLLTIEQNGRDREQLMAYAGGQAPAMLWFGPHIRDVEFNPHSLTALMVQPDAVATVSIGSGAQVIAGAQDGLANVIAAAVSGDGSKVYIAMESGQVMVRDLQAKTQTSISCSCQPTTLARLKGNAVFRLNEIGGTPLWLVDGDGAAPRVMFVASSQQ